MIWHGASEGHSEVSLPPRGPVHLATTCRERQCESCELCAPTAAVVRRWSPTYPAGAHPALPFTKNPETGWPSRLALAGWVLSSRRRNRKVGEILRSEFMEPMGITAYQLAKALHLPGIYEIVRGQRAISADVALRLGNYFGMTPQFWMNLQTDYDLRIAATTAPLSKIKARKAA